MATYKVIQDIEAEDKLLGPLTLRQFIYAGSCVLFLYLTFLAVTKNAAFMAAVFIPLAGASGFFAWPWGQDQPTEVWALAKIRFLVKPRKRIWNQSGVKELVTITAPKKVATVYSNGLSETEVQSRLRALADTIDSRGWAIKNVNVNMFSQPLPAAQAQESDRLISMESLPQAVPDIDIQPADDMLEENNAVSRQFDTMIAASTKAHRDEILKSLRGEAEEKTKQQQAAQQASANAKPAADYWFLNQPANATTVPTNAVTFNTQVVTPGATREELPVTPGDPTEDEEAVLERLRQNEEREHANQANTHWHTIQPLSSSQPPVAAAQPGFPQIDNQAVPQTQAYPQYAASQYAMPGQDQGISAIPQPQNGQIAYAPAYPTPQMAAAYATNGQQPTIATSQTPQPPVTRAPDPAILQLASNDDLDVATLARQANRHKEELQDEVVISLH